MPIIIYSPKFDDDSGGSVVLHQFCHLLNKIGVDAKIWPWDKPLSHNKSFFVFVAQYLKFIRKRILYKKKYISPYNLRIASYSDLSGCVAVYPEVINGNPLFSSTVVRWFLNKPGALTGCVDFGKDELYFYYDGVFDVEITPGQKNHLLRVVIPNPTYKYHNKKDRAGCCYMVRKGFKRAHLYHSKECLRVDGLKHAAMASVFNNCKYFYSYDLYTFYTSYAAICGCIPIVVPESGISEVQWQPNVSSRYGIAYGIEKIKWATDTRTEFLEEIHKMEVDSLAHVMNFVAQCELFFAIKLTKRE